MLIPLLLLSLGGRSLARLYESVADLPDLEYDFLVVGGGAAGNVVANRLTENPKFSVLLLEAGTSNLEISIVPLLVENLLSGPNQFEWNYSTTAQTGLDNRTITYPRARILGGCTAHNGMVYTRGSAEDYDRWASITGDSGWSWDGVLPYFFKNERWVPPAGNHDTRGQFNPAVHSTHGINFVSLSGSRWPVFENQVIQTTRELPEEFPFNLDFNSGEPLGVGWFQSTIGGGERSSSARTYLGPEFIQRPNLHVLLDAQVSKLVGPKTKSGIVSFEGVEFKQGGTLFNASAKNEIILSAGPIGTPTILMNSGIGDKHKLSALDIPTVLDLPSVGQNATDHPMIFASWSVNSTQTIDNIQDNTTLFNEAFAEWNKSHTGPFTNVPVTHILFTRVDANSTVFENVTDPAAGPETPHIEIYLSTGNGPLPEHFITFGLLMLTPTSRGSITLASNNPFDPPLVDPGLLASPVDLALSREAVAKAYRFVQAPVWKDYIIAPTTDLGTLTTDELDVFIQTTASSSGHIVGTAAMSARDASYGVVNPDLLVKGASGLRIIDASIMPMIPTAHTQAGTYAIAERGADLVKGRWV
ncbi:aryl-alcohol oxidase-like protein [Roridomyces roridus]|uniref:Aryl-alcohol oxidase-like protein n=1 Tax=Roridomyces roridus TaxID=1738132 RepID=A0AAD7AYJ2_9AGAR|nr:aryl-alcohol oxidase-like protein [Roridomyces roridus]